MNQENNKKVVHTIKVSGLFNTPPSEEEINEAMKEFKRLQQFLRWFPMLFIVVTIFIFIAVMQLFSLKFPAFLLIVMSTIMILKEASTLLFSVQMRKRIMKPIERLRVAVDELSKGHYGYQVEEEPGNIVGDLITSFNEMSRDLKEAEEIKAKYERNRNELIAGISHDLKTPITSIVGYVDAIQTGVASTVEKRDTYLNIISANAHYTNQLIDDLFLFSKIDVKQMKYDFVQLPVVEFLTDIIVEKQLELEESGVVVDYDLDIPKEKMLPIDGKMVYRIISNILSNALKYGDKVKPEIYIEGRNIDGGVEVHIRDNGPGINQDDLKQIFEVFYRADASRNKEIGGTGLGLAIARQLVEAHGGKIWATSAIGKGTTLSFTLMEHVIEEEQHG